MDNIHTTATKGETKRRSIAKLHVFESRVKGKDGMGNTNLIPLSTRKNTRPQFD